MVYTTLACMVSKVTDPAIIRKAAYTPKGLYKFLIRQCQRLPGEEISAYYKHHVRQSFNQHADESDPERVVQIINQAVKDIHWVLQKLLPKMESKSSSSEVISESPEDNIVVEAEVPSVYKFFNALSTFASRPELVIPHIRSTDIDWSSLITPLRKCCNDEDCENILEFMYSPIYHHGRCMHSIGAGELSGSLHDDTIKSWTEDSSTRVINLKRIIHHKPANKESKVGWSSVVEESWDFIERIVRLVPLIDKTSSDPFPYVPIATLEAQFIEDEKKARLTIRPFRGPLIPGIEDGMEFNKRVLIPKIIEWMSDSYIVDPPKLTRLRSKPLSYVNNAFYWLCYDLLKSGPAEEIKSIWEEATDPVKFIHEDIGIASYVVAFIFSKSSRYLPINNTEHVDVLDLGCGNGLLCYFIFQLLSLFSKTGSVVGFDIRKRKIWKNLVENSSQTDKIHAIYQEVASSNSTNEIGKINFKLTERTFVPNEMDDLSKTYACTIEERQNRSLWIIGNHSDELTPWIPVVSRRLNSTGFFIIPCCAYDYFFKYQRRANIPGSSIYQNYIEYICTVGDKFGYLPTLEKLRIPSTKNICLLGLDCSRKFDPEVLHNEVKQILNELKEGDQGSSFTKFTPRSKEDAKTSLKLDKTLSEAIADKIFQLLIDDWKSLGEDGKWYSGREDLTFQDIFLKLTPDEKGMLKGKGNGLKTLVRTYRNLFVTEGFHVKLRVPHRADIETVNQTRRDRIKTRPCYFHRKHPQGCPLSSELCTYLHE